MSADQLDAYGDRYTIVDRDRDEKRAKPCPGRCSICDRRLPCRHHGEGPAATAHRGIYEAGETFKALLDQIDQQPQPKE